MTPSNPADNDAETVVLVSPTPQRREFFPTLESLRGIAALWVVVYHLLPWRIPPFDMPLVFHGYMMVNLFFVLSGFVLYHSSRDKLNDAQQLKRFVGLRLGRIYPLHLLFLLLFGGLELAKYAARQRGIVGSSDFSLSQIASAFTNQLLLTHSFIPAVGPNLNFPAWSISAEFWTYLLFAAVVMLCRKHFLAACAALSLLGMAVPLVFQQAVVWQAGLLRCVAGFFLGCICAKLFERFRNRPPRIDFAAPTAIVSLLLLSRGWRPAGEIPLWWEQLAYPLSALLLLGVLLKPDSWFNWMLGSRPLRFLGAISYSLYMCHALVQWAFVHAVQRFLGADLGTLTNVSLLRALPLYAACLLLTLVVATLTYRFVEDPARRASRRLFSTAGAGLPLPVVPASYQGRS